MLLHSNTSGQKLLRVQYLFKNSTSPSLSQLFHFVNTCLKILLNCSISWTSIFLNDVKYQTLLNLCCFQAKAQNDFSDDMYTSKWHYAKDIVNREKVSGTTTGFSNYDYHETEDRTQVCRKLKFCRCVFNTKSLWQCISFWKGKPNYKIKLRDFFLLLPDPQAFDFKEWHRGSSVPE